jgi:UDP-GlcNAc3NAcA epimerase
MRVLTVLGARPQFIKAATVSRSFKSSGDIEEIIIHTGQHFDANMSQVFFDQLGIPHPHHNLKISGLSHGAMTGRMLEGIESLIQQEKPNWILVYGDTNSTLAGALAAAKLQIPVAHVEAGLRSNNFSMPEEINRILTDRISSLLLCPTQIAINNLHKEGFPFLSTGNRIQSIANIGDVMFDAVNFYRERAFQQISLGAFGLKHQEYALCTIHRQENTDSPQRLDEILSALRSISKQLPVTLPLHPRTRAKIEQQLNPKVLDGLNILGPIPYLEMQRLEMSAKLILTDSGGVQKEACFYGVPCITLRDETEWVETIESGWNCLVGAEKDKILSAFDNISVPKSGVPTDYGDGKAAEKILKILMAQL